MKRNLVRYASAVVLVSLIIPSVTFAAWWNPFTWFHKKSVINQSQEIEQLKKEVEELKKQNSVSVPAPKSVSSNPKSTSSNTPKQQIKTPSVSLDGSWDVYANDGTVLLHVPIKEERMGRLNAICMFIGEIKHNIDVPNNSYCSLVGMSGEAGKDYRLLFDEFVSNSKPRIEAAMKEIIDFEKLRKTKLDALVREAQQPQQQSNCSYAIQQKNSLDIQAAQSGTLFSTSRAQALGTLKAQYPNCF